MSDFRIAESRGVYGEMNEKTLVYTGDEPTTLERAWYITMLKWNILRRCAASGMLVRDGLDETCGLCMLFRCPACPIGLAGFPACAGTAFAKYNGAVGGMRTDLALYAAKEEIEILKTIRLGYKREVHDDKL